MLVEQSSPLRRLPASADRRTVLFLDGIRYSIEIGDLSFGRLSKTLERIAELGESNEGLAAMIVEAVSDAWVLVDSIHRLRSLVAQLPGLKQNQPAVQAFLRGTLSADTFRNYVQHFRSGIDGFVTSGRPLWGTLSWSQVCSITGLPKSHVVIPGTFYAGVGAATGLFDTPAGRFEDTLVLHAGEAQVDLKSAFERLGTFSRWFQYWAADTFRDPNTLGSDMHLQVAVKLVPRPQP